MASPVALAPAERREMAASPLVPLALFCAGHFVIDLYAGALGVLQPLLHQRFGLTFTEAGFLAGTLVLSGSVLQPVYGYLSDRFHSRLFTVLAPAIAGGFIAALGLASGFWTLLLMVFLGGAGVASFHPHAAANAIASVRQNRGRAMAIFVCSGSLGMALAPASFSFFLGYVGLERLPWAAMAGLLMTALLFRYMPASSRRNEHGPPAWDALRAVWRPLTLLYLLVVIRSVVQITFTQFLPLYLHDFRGYSLQAASLITSIYLLGGTFGGLAGGNLADRFGGRVIIQISMIGSLPFLALFAFTTGPVSAVGLFLGGLLLFFTVPVNVVMAQQLAPAQAGTISALMMGFAWGMAGLIFIPLTGWVSDLWSMQTAIIGLITFPLFGFVLALKLPADRK